jgi:tetratricopeptide (TPR) repeat protein
MHDHLPDLEKLSVFDARLRQVPRDPIALTAAARLAARQLRQARSTGDPVAELRLRGYLGTAHRILGHWRSALTHLRAAYSLARAVKSPSAEVVSLVRLGEAERCRDAFPRAEAYFREALAKIRGDPRMVVYEDFALQHLGKCLLDAGAHAEAVSCLEAALKLRKCKADAALVASTEAALALARRYSADAR